MITPNVRDRDHHRIDHDDGTIPPNTCAMHWSPIQTPMIGMSGPNSLMTSIDTPESSGRPDHTDRVLLGEAVRKLSLKPGPGEMRIPRGFIFLISPTDLASL